MQEGKEKVEVIEQTSKLVNIKGGQDLMLEKVSLVESKLRVGEKRIT